MSECAVQGDRVGPRLGQEQPGSSTTGYRVVNQPTVRDRSRLSANSSRPWPSRSTRSASGPPRQSAAARTNAVSSRSCTEQSKAASRRSAGARVSAPAGWRVAAPGVLGVRGGIQGRARPVVPRAPAAGWANARSTAGDGRTPPAPSPLREGRPGRLQRRGPAAAYRVPGGVEVVPEDAPGDAVDPEVVHREGQHARPRPGGAPARVHHPARSGSVGGPGRFSSTGTRAAPPATRSGP
ncbi:hypothetical protein CFP59_09504 [Streptomyces malaysiensis subsp. malaysiensis]|nr:hypothetical protein CFP59_09504 [Streptomyces sp. M56]